VDPINSARPGNPQTWNKYVYGANNPAKFVDPNGEVPLPFVTGGIGLVAGAIGSAVGQVIVNKGFKNFSTKDVAIAGGVGLAAGAAAPFVATTTTGAAVLGVIANVLQVGTTELANGRDITREKLAFAATTGLVAGAVAGPVSRSSGVRFSENSVLVPAENLAIGKAINETADAALNITGANLTRSAAATAVSNIDLDIDDLVGLIENVVEKEKP